MGKAAVFRRAWSPDSHSLHSHQQEVAELLLWIPIFGLQLQPRVSDVYFNGPRKWVWHSELTTN